MKWVEKKTGKKKKRINQRQCGRGEVEAAENKNKGKDWGVWFLTKALRAEDRITHQQRQGRR